MAGRLKLGVEMADGRKYVVTIDQRDYATWEMQDFYREDRTVTRMRFWAYCASVREKQTGLSWPKFNADLLLAEVAEDDVIEVDPTQPDRSAED
jgi:hypothetical protein